MTVQYDTGEQIDHILYQNIHSFDIFALKEIIFRGKLSNRRVTSLSVVLEIRNVTNKAVSARLNDWEISRVLQNLSRMLEKAKTYMAKVPDNGNPWQIKIQVIDSSSTNPKTTGKLKYGDGNNTRSLSLSLALSYLSNNYFWFHFSK